MTRYLAVNSSTIFLERRCTCEDERGCCSRPPRGPAAAPRSAGTRHTCSRPARAPAGKLSHVKQLAVSHVTCQSDSILTSTMSLFITFNQGFTFVLKTGLPDRATSIDSRLPDKTFWLPDNINVKTYSKIFWLPCRATRGQLLVGQEEMVAPGNRLRETLVISNEYL